MHHQTQTRKALSLFGLILLTGLFCGAQSAAVFTQGPTATPQGDSAVSITFTVSEATDVEVGIADANGKIINHLAAGVLGGTYPPPAPLAAGLSQSVVWDFRDDDGGLAMGAGYKVRVRLGVRPKFVWKTGGRNMTDENHNPQKDFLTKDSPFMTGTQNPCEMWVNSGDQTEDVFYRNGLGSFGFYFDGKISRFNAATGQALQPVSVNNNLFFKGVNDNASVQGKSALDVKNNVFYVFGGASGAPEGQGALYRFNMDGQPAPWPQTGKYWVGGLAPIHFGCGWAGGEKGHCVGPDGEIYVNSAEASLSNTTEGLQVKVVKDGVIIDTCRIQVHAWFSTIKVDRRGNIYVGCNPKPKDNDLPEDALALLNPVPDYVSVSRMSSLTASIIKFPPTGGSIKYTTSPDYDYRWYWQGNLQYLKSSGVEWSYFGFSKFCGWDVTCWCATGSFDLDNWGRLFLPNSMQAQMVAIDNNRNVIYKIRNREIPEAGGIIPYNIAVTDNYVIVGDGMNASISGFRLTAQESTSVALPPSPLWVPLQKWALSFYADNGVTSPADPAIGIMAGSGTVSTLTVTPDSSWLKVTVSGNGAEQVIHHTADVTGLVDGRTYTTKVKITAAGFVTTWYTASMTVGVPKVQSIKLTPKTVAVGPNSTTQFSLEMKDQYNQKISPLPATVWSVSGGGSINNTGLFQCNVASGIFTVRVSAESNLGVMDSATIKVVLSTGCAVTASSSLEYNPWGKKSLTDGTTTNAFSSDCEIMSGDEWVEIDLGGDKPFSRVIITPRQNSYTSDGKSYGFPVDFTITAKTAAGVTTTLVTKTGYANPDSGAVQTFDFTSVEARYVRLLVTKFGVPPGGECRLQLAEIEILDMDNVSTETTIFSPLYFGLTAVPNPFAASTLVKFNVPQSKSGEKQKVSVRIYDLNGKLVQTLAQGMFAAGYHTVAFNGRENGNGRTLGNGIYFCRMQAPGYSRTLKLLLVQ